MKLRNFINMLVALCLGIAMSQSGFSQEQKGGSFGLQIGAQATDFVLLYAKADSRVRDRRG